MHKQKIYLGMEEEAFLKIYPGARQENGPSGFRRVYRIDSPWPGVEALLTYIDSEEEVLYEYILIYSSADPLEKGQAYLGRPNHEGEEWRISPDQTKLPFTVAAWTYRNKLIYAGNIPGTEWAEGFN